MHKLLIFKFEKKQNAIFSDKFMNIYSNNQLDAEKGSIHSKADARAQNSLSIHEIHRYRRGG